MCDKNEKFYRLISERDVRKGLGDNIIEKCKKCFEGYKYICFNCEFNGEFREKDEKIRLKGKKIEYLVILLQLCCNDVEGIGFFSNIYND